MLVLVVLTIDSVLASHVEYIILEVSFVATCLLSAFFLRSGNYETAARVVAFALAIGLVIIDQLVPIDTNYEFPERIGTGVCVLIIGYFILNRTSDLLFLSLIIVLDKLASLLRVYLQIDSGSWITSSERIYVPLAGLIGSVSILILTRIIFLKVLRDAEERAEEAKKREVAERERKLIEEEIQTAAQIQASLLPTKMPGAVKDRIAAFSRPAKGVSGDYYDVLAHRHTSTISVAVCDVAGKGVPASIVMVMLRTIIHTILHSVKSPSEVLRWANHGILGQLEYGRFATMAFMNYHPVDGQIEFSNAAHPPILLLRSSTREFEFLDGYGMPLGLEKNSEYETVTRQLSDQDILVFYTDGIVEAKNALGEMFGELRLKEAIISNSALPAQGIAAAVRAKVDGFVASALAHDDMTLIVLKHPQNQP